MAYVRTRGLAVLGDGPVDVTDERLALGRHVAIAHARALAPALGRGRAVGHHEVAMRGDLAHRGLVRQPVLRAATLTPHEDRILHIALQVGRPVDGAGADTRRAVVLDDHLVWAAARPLGMSTGFDTAQLPAAGAAAAPCACAESAPAPVVTASTPATSAAVEMNPASRPCREAGREGCVLILMCTPESGRERRPNLLLRHDGQSDLRGVLAAFVHCHGLSRATGWIGERQRQADAMPRLEHV